MADRARGPFDVKLTPLPLEDAGEGAQLGRLSIDKTYRGDLQATGKGQMLTAQASVDGSAGYVAIEKVTGSLGGRDGSFVLQHSGTMARGQPQLSVSVVPDSGTGDLAGLSGTLTIRIENGKHTYDFEYTLPRTS